MTSYRVTCGQEIVARKTRFCQQRSRIPQYIRTVLYYGYCTVFAMKIYIYGFETSRPQRQLGSYKAAPRQLGPMDMSASRHLDPTDKFVLELLLRAELSLRPRCP